MPVPASILILNPPRKIKMKIRRNRRLRKAPRNAKGRFVKATFKRKTVKRKATRKAVKRRTSHRVRRVVLRKGKRKASVTLRLNPRRKRRVRRNSARKTISALLTKRNLTIAGGALASVYLTSLLIKRFGQYLPMIGNKWGQVVYSIALPTAAAYLTTKVVKGDTGSALAQGMVVGGLVSGATSVIGILTAPNATATAPATVSAYVNTRLPTVANPRLNSRQTVAAGIYSSEPAFASDPWSKRSGRN